MQHDSPGHYAVIFTAHIRQLDERYRKTAQRMRELAMSEFGCHKFTACTEGDTEIAISYWDCLDQVSAWRNHPEHLQAQSLGQTTWYSHYCVEVTRIERAYSSGA